MIAFLEGQNGRDVELIDQALLDQVGVFTPVTVTELLSDPELTASTRNTISAIPVLPILNGFWERAGILRAKVLKRGRKAKLADTLIAQSCIDHQTTLVSRDQDFEIFKKLAGLKLLWQFRVRQVCDVLKTPRLGRRGLIHHLLAIVTELSIVPPSITTNKGGVLAWKEIRRSTKHARLSESRKTIGKLQQGCPVNLKKSRDQ
jgi:predicted nucleic acid-binding protein